MAGTNLKSKMIDALDDALAERVKDQFAIFVGGLIEAPGGDIEPGIRFRKAIRNDLVAYDAAARIINGELPT